MKGKSIVKFSAVAAAVTFTSAAYAAQPVNIVEIRCGNNGSGNGDELLEVVVAGAEETKCAKFQPLYGDTKPASPGNNVDLDPQSSNNNYKGPAG